MLKFKQYDDEHQHLIVMLHGFLGSLETFQPAVSMLLPHVDVLLVECPGHGDDFNPDEVWTFEAMAQALADKIRALRHEYQTITLYGYSMGGRIALYTALHYPALIDKLIIESATPGIESDTLRQQRIDKDNIRSKMIEQNYTAFIDEWEQLSLFKTFKPLTEAQQTRQRYIRMHHHPAGVAKALRDYGTGKQMNLWPMLKNFNKPVLLLTGILDQKFESIAKRMTEHLPRSKHMIIQAGHTIHVENLEIFDTIIVSFIKEENHD